MVAFVLHFGFGCAALVQVQHYVGEVRNGGDGDDDCDESSDVDHQRILIRCHWT